MNIWGMIFKKKFLRLLPLTVIGPIISCFHHYMQQQKVISCVIRWLVFTQMLTLLHGLRGKHQSAVCRFVFFPTKQSPKRDPPHPPPFFCLCSVSWCSRGGVERVQHFKKASQSHPAASGMSRALPEIRFTAYWLSLILHLQRIWIWCANSRRVLFVRWVWYRSDAETWHTYPPGWFHNRYGWSHGASSSFF